MDRVTRDYMEKFLSMYEIESEEESKDFEKFCAYCTLKKDYSKTVSVDLIEEIVVASPSDMGIDSIAIIVEDELITEIEQIDALVEKHEQLKAVFIFVQAKTVNQFDRTDFRDFTGGIKEFFNKYLEQPVTRNSNAKIKHKVNLATYLLKECLMKFSERPTCKVYYINTESEVSTPQTRSNLIESERKELENTNLFDNVEINVKGIKFIHSLYRNTLSKPKVSIEFIQRTPLPNIEGIQEAHIGVLPFAEFRKLIIDESDNIRTSVFEENVRYFNEKFRVNQDIKQTIKEGKIDRFVVLNNGITIVAKVVKPVGRQLVLEDYQIVNGCQTSHVLYESRNIKGIDSLHIGVKIIYTNNQDLINSIITATNNQTPVKQEALSSLLDFQKSLENLYNTYKIPEKNGHQENRLYYERQEGQYIGKNIAISKIIPINLQARCVAAMFLDVPHQSAREYRKVRERISKEIFAKNDETIPYFISALTYYETYKILRSKIHQLKKYQKFKFHILLVIKYLIIGLEVPELNNRKINESCQKILKVLDTVLDNKKTNKFLGYVKISINLIEKASLKLAQKDGIDDPINNLDTNQKTAFTNYLIEEVTDYTREQQTKSGKDKP